MYAVSDEFLNAIRSSHAIIVKATAYRGGSIVTGAEDLAVVDGSVRVDGRSKVRRTVEGLNIVSADGSTSTLRSLLTVSGTEIQLYRGVRFPNGRDELAPVGRFRIEAVTDDLSQAGVVSITAPDLTARVIDDRFMTPRAGNAGATIVAQITALIQETIPNAAVFDSSGSTATVPSGIVWERERWDAIEELGTSIGCTVYCDPEGNWRIEPVSSLSSPALWIVNAGTNAVLLGGTRSATRDGVFNVVVASSSPTDGTAPVYAIAQDTDPASPTYVSGPYGRVPRFYSSPLLTTTIQAQAAAQTILDRSLGVRGALALTTMVNPALEVGDRIDVALPSGEIQRCIADGFTVPLTPDGSMPIANRSTTEDETP